MRIREQHPSRTEIVVSWASLFKLLGFAVLAIALFKMEALAWLLVLACFIAITLVPLARAVERRGGPRWLGIATCAVVLLGPTAAFLFIIMPLAAEQIGALLKTLPDLKTQVLQKLPEHGPLHEMAAGLMQSPAFTDPAPLLKQCVDLGATAIAGLLQLLVVLVIALYLLADGKRVFEWILAFVTERQRARVAQAAPEIEAVIFSYMRGQLITSLLCAGFSFGALTILKVPNALILAMVAGVLDVLPIIGFFLSVIPAAAVALTISPPVSAAVAALYTAYHLIENYFIVPRVYGNHLRLSGLTVLIACLAAGMVKGVIGIIVILPIVASYPIIERIWLRPVVGADTVDRHEASAELEEKENGALAKP